MQKRLIGTALGLLLMTVCISGCISGSSNKGDFSNPYGTSSTGTSTDDGSAVSWSSASDGSTLAAATDAVTVSVSGGTITQVTVLSSVLTQTDVNVAVTYQNGVVTFTAVGGTWPSGVITITFQITTDSGSTTGTVSFTVPAAPTPTPTPTPSTNYCADVTPLAKNPNKLFYHQDVSGIRQIFSINVDGTGATQLTFDTDGGSQTPTYGADGHVWFVSSHTQLDGSNDYEVYRMRPDGTSLCQATDNSYVNGYASVTNDSQYFVHTTLQLTISKTRVNDYTNEEIIVPSNNSSNGAPTVCPNDKMLYVSDRTGSSRLYTINLDGTGDAIIPGLHAVMGGASCCTDGSNNTWVTYSATNGYMYVAPMAGNSHTIIAGGTEVDFSDDCTKLYFLRSGDIQWTTSDGLGDIYNITGTGAGVIKGGPSN